MKLKTAMLATTLIMASSLLPSAMPARSSAGIAARGSSEPRVIQITARQFEFAPAQITLKKGESVTLQLTSADVKHGFYIRGLKVDELIEPGKTTEVHLTPQAAGTYPTICDHLCGPGHGNMKMTIVVEE